MLRAPFRGRVHVRETESWSSDRSHPNRRHSRKIPHEANNRYRLPFRGVDTTARAFPFGTVRIRVGMVSHSLVVKDDPMRKQHWMSAFLSGLMLLGVTSAASAQGPPPGFTGHAGHTPVGYDGVPVNYLPYPQVSPFDHVFDSTYEENGIWMRETHNSPFRYRFGMDALLAQFKKAGGAMIGEPGARRSSFFRGGPRAIDNNDTGLDIQAIDPDTLDFNTGRGPFLARNSDLLRGAFGSGMSLTFGIDAPDGQSIEFNGFGIFDAIDSASYGRPIRSVGDVEDPFAALEVRYILGDTTFDAPFFGPVGGVFNNPTYLVDLNAVNAFMPAIPLNDGTPDGTLVRADHYYHTFMQSRAYGAGVTWAHIPQSSWGPFSVQMTLGVRYIQIKERFGLRAHDSGADYEFETDPDEEEYGNVDTFFINGPNDPTRMSLDSYTDVDMAGPEIGLRYDTGGDSFSLFGETKFGVMGARERLQVDAKGLGQQFLFNQVGNFGPLSFNPFYDHSARSRRTLQNSYVTPTFQQTLNTRSKLLSALPLIGDIPAFREANFTAGYSILMAFQVSRPDSSIVWNANTGYDPTDPDTSGLAPTPKIDRQMWFVHYLNLGVEWEY